MKFLIQALLVLVVYLVQPASIAESISLSVKEREEAKDRLLDKQLKEQGEREYKRLKEEERNFKRKEASHRRAEKARKIRQKQAEASRASQRAKEKALAEEKAVREVREREERIEHNKREVLRIEQQEAKLEKDLYNTKRRRESFAKSIGYLNIKNYNKRILVENVRRVCHSEFNGILIEEDFSKYRKGLICKYIYKTIPFLKHPKRYEQNKYMKGHPRQASVRPTCNYQPTYLDILSDPEVLEIQD